MSVHRSCRCASLRVGLTLLLTVSPCFAQNRSTSNQPLKPIVGTVERISGNVIYVKTGTQLMALSVDNSTDVWKGKVFHELSPVVVGDTIIARYRTEASGKLVAEAIWLNIVNFSGVITKVAEDGFEMFTNPNADPESAYKKEAKSVSVDVDTLFESSAEGDLKPGREVHLVGLDLRDGRILATRVTVYEGNRPVRMGNGKITLPNGQTR
jgi:Domain of unknown function (DUF5666)